MTQIVRLSSKRADAGSRVVPTKHGRRAEFAVGGTFWCGMRKAR
jgi:hypothetical protein